MIGTSLGAKGGVSGVVKQYFASPLVVHNRIYYIASHQDGGIFKKIKAALTGYGVFLYRLISVRPDIVHIHGASRNSFYRKSLFVLVSKLFSKKVIYHHHGGEFMIFFHQESNWLSRKWIGWIFKKSDLILTLSENWKANLLSIDKTLKIKVLPNPVSIPLLSSGKKKSPVTIIFMGRLVSAKGIDDLIDAALTLLSKSLSFELVFYGEGEEERFRQRCREKNLDGHVMFKGWIDGKEKEIAYIDGDIFVLPSYNEGLPMGILEAMSYGLPVVATRVGGIPDAVKEGVNGFLITPGDVQALAACLEKLIVNPNLRREMGRVGRELATTHFEVSIVTEALETIYNELAGFVVAG